MDTLIPTVKKPRHQSRHRIQVVQPVQVRQVAQVVQLSQVALKSKSLSRRQNQRKKAKFKIVCRRKLIC